MSDELPEIFEQLRPAGAPAELRVRVLAAVDKQLAARRKPAWERALELGVAACLALGIGLNAWQWERETRWHAAQQVVPSGYARNLADGDQRLAEFVNKRLAQRPRPATPAAPFGEDYQKLLSEITESPAG